MEVTIGRNHYTFIGEDEERIKKVATYVDSKVTEVLREHKIVNTVNVLVMALMEMADEYLELKERLGKIETSTNRLLKKIEEI
ncbi:MAG: cell division protein ZapA [Deltaproteobacteria bacterium]|nr:cell division protein ZapA [Deltaproteobacteria bacterium]